MAQKLCLLVSCHLSVTFLINCLEYYCINLCVYLLILWFTFTCRRVAEWIAQIHQHWIAAQAYFIVLSSSK